MKNIGTRISATLTSGMSYALLAFPVLAATPIYDPTKLVDENKKHLPALAQNLQTDPGIIIANIINIAMGFLGVVAVCIIIWAGFRWMTSGGEEKGAEAAQAMMKNGIIGLVIILASWILAHFVIAQLAGVFK